MSGREVGADLNERDAGAVTCGSKGVLHISQLRSVGWFKKVHAGQEMGSRAPGCVGLKIEMVGEDREDEISPE